MKIIDMWAPIVPSREIMSHVATHFPEMQLSYLSIFQKRDVTLAAYEKVAKGMAMDDDGVVELLDAANVEKSLITGFVEPSTAGDTFVSNESVAAIAERLPNRFIPFCGADILKGADAVRDVDHWIRERGFKGLSLRPFAINLPPTDRRYYPFYAKCVELSVPLSIHASANWTRDRVSDLGHPRHFDQVACDFPDLKMILSHAGYPWVLEACLIAWKHPNVYLELGAHRPRYFTAPGAGWEPLLRYGQTTIQDKILYGTGAYLISRTPKELIDEMLQLPVAPEILNKWMYANAARLMNL